MKREYEYNSAPSDRVSEPAVSTYTVSTNVLSIGVPQKDMGIAIEMIDRMGWIMYSRSQAEGSQQRIDKVRNAIAHLKGCISLPEGYDYKRDIAEYLAEKYSKEN